MKKKFFYIFFLAFINGHIFAKHIVGGEIIYDALGGNNYKITLKVYRDCFSTGAAFDGLPNTNGAVLPAILTVYEAGGVLNSTYDLGVPVITNIPPSINNPCIQAPGGICVEEGIYTYTLNLPPKAGGYYLVYQRCCRNGTILNLVVPDSQGSTYYTFIPGPEVVATNSSPRYKNFPPIFICNNLPFTFDHSATDPDGDQLVYSLCPPFLGLDQSCPGLNGSGTCPVAAPPPPYQNVNYSSTYSGTYPIASNPAFSINPSTGLLTGTPNLIGQFVVSICVQEFRNGVLINTHYRDFQFNVVSCIVQVASIFADQPVKCQGSTITFTNQSFGNLGGLTYAWDFGVLPLSNDTSRAVNPTYTYQDTGKYTVTLIANPGKPCSDTMKKVVYVYPLLDIKFPKQAKQCLKGNSFTFTTQGMYTPQAAFLWDFTSAATPSTSSVKNPGPIIYTQPGKYFVKLVAKQYGCIDSFIDSVRVIPRPISKINNLPLTQCNPAKVAFSNGSSSVLPLTYQWLFSNGNISSEFQPVQIFSPAGIYSATLIVTTSSVCVDTSMSAVNNITVNPAPMAGFTFSPQITTIFDPEISFLNASSGDVTNWQYNFGDGSGSVYPNELHVYQEPGEYSVTQIVNNQFNCFDTIKHSVKILPEFRFWIPNTFTPDDNLLNDYFMPVAIGTLNYEFDIFTRWGEHIFSTKNPKQGWNGFYNGKECKEDTYVWRITFKNAVTLKDAVHFGHVVLLKKN
ncbi:MAG: PKD domain-containing protein [Bacteroidetes bacterium]|nr:PKD domain-containing protein [Bacteroidota bacterium]